MLTVDRNDFVTALKLCKHVLPSSTTMPAAQNILLRVSGGELEMIATDLTAVITVAIPIVDNDGTALDTTIDGDKVDAVIPKMESDLVKIQVLDNGKVKISSSRKYSTFATIPSSEFPMLRIPEEKPQYLPIEPDTFSNHLQAAISQVGDSVTDKPMNAYSGIYLTGYGNELRVMSSDRTRGYFASIPFENEVQFDALLWLAGHQGVYKSLTTFANVEIAADTQRFYLRGQRDGVDVQFVALTMADEYPQIYDVIREVHDDMSNPVRALVDAKQFKNDLAPTVKFEKLFVSLALDDGTLIFESTDQNDSYRVELDAQIEGDYTAFKMFLSKLYIRDILNHIDTPMVQILVDNIKGSPAAFMSPSDGEFETEIGKELFFLAKMEV